ncbi:Nucleotidyltransferase [Athelia psychrophila]|uniref:DNA-directed DNA polymerase n=1 Tax=Athelia psychrophila TaxID=1759441 RepID=A0A166QWC5_9AGAM|nr:Nucleotidyltransferase [Fibularhizoctonia sp. CBS 109695]
MPFKRPSPTRNSSSNVSSRAPKHPRTSLSGGCTNDRISTIAIYILQTKLDSNTTNRLFSIAESEEVYISQDSDSASGTSDGVRFELCHEIDEAEVIITAVHMRKRLERHIAWEVATAKAIVTPAWLFESARRGTALPCGDYAAVEDLLEKTAQNCPDKECRCTAKNSGSPPASSVSGASIADEGLGLGDTSSLSLKYDSRYACCRASPLVCPNQGLVEALDIMRQSRALEGEERSALSYEKAVAVAFPDLIDSRNLQAAQALPFLGKKLGSMVEEYVQNGAISECKCILSSERFISLSAFTTIYGIGPHTARNLYARGLRTIDDLNAFYGLYDFENLDINSVEVTDSEQVEESDGENVVERSILTSLALRKELAETIPRAEVEEMRAVVMRELDIIATGCTSTIAGGYRRGKPQSNDIDLIITHPDPARAKGLGKCLVNRLYEQGLITHVMHLSSFHAPNTLRTTHWDSLEKSLTIFKLPAFTINDTPRLHRRLDLILAVPDVYWTAVVGWTGSKMFERDLRLWAKEQKGLKFDSAGITRRRDAKAYYPRSEKEVFDLLGLEMVPPHLRNA